MPVIRILLYICGNGLLFHGKAIKFRIVQQNPTCFLFYRNIHARRCNDYLIQEQIRELVRAFLSVGVNMEPHNLTVRRNGQTCSAQMNPGAGRNRTHRSDVQIMWPTGTVFIVQSQIQRCGMVCAERMRRFVVGLCIVSRPVQISTEAVGLTWLDDVGIQFKDSTLPNLCPVVDFQCMAVGTDGCIVGSITASQLCIPRACPTLIGAFKGVMQQQLGGIHYIVTPHPNQRTHLNILHGEFPIGIGCTAFICTDGNVFQRSLRNLQLKGEAAAHIGRLLVLLQQRTGRGNHLDGNRDLHFLALPLKQCGNRLCRRRALHRRTVRRKPLFLNAEGNGILRGIGNGVLQRTAILPEGVSGNITIGNIHLLHPVRIGASGILHRQPCVAPLPAGCIIQIELTLAVDGNQSVRLTAFNAPDPETDGVRRVIHRTAVAPDLLYADGHVPLRHRRIAEYRSTAAGVFHGCGQLSLGILSHFDRNRCRMAVVKDPPEIGLAVNLHRLAGNILPDGVGVGTGPQEILGVKGNLTGCIAVLSVDQLSVLVQKLEHELVCADAAVGQLLAGSRFNGCRLHFDNLAHVRHQIEVQTGVIRTLVVCIHHAPVTHIKHDAGNGNIAFAGAVGDIRFRLTDLHVILCDGHDLSSGLQQQLHVKSCVIHLTGLHPLFLLIPALVLGGQLVLGPPRRTRRLIVRGIIIGVTREVIGLNDRPGSVINVTVIYACDIRVKNLTGGDLIPVLVCHGTLDLVKAAVRDLDIRMVVVEILLILGGIRYVDVKDLIAKMHFHSPGLIGFVLFDDFPTAVCLGGVGLTDRSHCPRRFAPKGVGTGTVRVDTKLYCISHLENIGTLFRVLKILAVIFPRKSQVQPLMHHILAPLTQSGIYIDYILFVGGGVTRQIIGQLNGFPLRLCCRFRGSLRGGRDLHHRRPIVCRINPGACHRMYMLRQSADQLTAVRIACSTVLMLLHAANGFICHGNAHAPQRPCHRAGYHKSKDQQDPCKPYISFMSCPDVCNATVSHISHHAFCQH